MTDSGDFSLGDKVEVRGHGAGVVTGLGCCGYPGSVEVTYTDGSKYHCQRCNIKHMADKTRDDRKSSNSVLVKLFDPDLSSEDSLPLLRALGSSELNTAISRIPDAVDALATTAQVNQLQSWGLLLGELQRRQEPGSAPANAAAGYGELRLEACSSRTGTSSSSSAKPTVLVEALQAAVVHCPPDRADAMAGEEKIGEGPGRRGLHGGLMERLLGAMPATDGQRSALCSALFGPAPGLGLLNDLRKAVDAPLPEPEKSAASNGQSDVNEMPGLAVEDSFWDSSSSSGPCNNLQSLLESPAVSASLSNPDMLAAFLCSAKRVRDVLARQKPSLGSKQIKAWAIGADESDLRPYFEAASKSLELRKADASEQVTTCLDVALLAAVHSGKLRPLLEWLEFVTSGELGSDITLGALRGTRFLALAACMFPLRFAFTSSRSFVSAPIPAVGQLGLAMRMEIPASGMELKLFRSMDVRDQTAHSADIKDSSTEQEKGAKRDRKRKQAGTEAPVTDADIQAGSAVTLISDESAFKLAFESVPYVWDDAMRSILGTEQIVVQSASGGIFGLERAISDSPHQVWFYPISVVTSVKKATSSTSDSKASAFLGTACPVATLFVSGGRANVEIGGSSSATLPITGRSLLVEFFLNFQNTELEIILNGKSAGKGPLPADDIAIMVVPQSGVEADTENLQWWPSVLPLPESQCLAELLTPADSVQVAYTPLMLCAVVASHLRTLNLWHVHSHDTHASDGSERLYNILDDVEVRDIPTDPWKPATVVCRGSGGSPRLKVKLEPQASARSWKEVRPWRPLVTQVEVADIDRLVQLAHGCLRLLTENGDDGRSAAPVAYHVARLLRIALLSGSASAPAQVLVLVSGLLSWARADINDGTRTLIASAALRILVAVCPALSTHAGRDVVELLQAVVAVAPAVPAELWLLRWSLLNRCSVSALISQLQIEGRWPALLRKLGTAAVRPGALSLCALLLRASLTSAGQPSITSETSEADADGHGLTAFLDHTAAAIIGGVVSVKEPGVHIDLPCCMLLATKIPSLAVRAAPRAVALVGAIAKADAPAEILLSLVQATCQLCLKLLPDRDAAAPPPEVLRSLRCLPETSHDGLSWTTTSGLAVPQVQIANESQLREWLSDGSASAMPQDPEADVCELAAQIPGVLGTRTRAVEVAVLRLLRCADTSAEQADIASSNEAELLRAAARRFLSEQQDTAAGERERVVAEMGEKSVWLAAHWVVRANHAVQSPVQLLRSRSSIVTTSKLQRSMSNLSPKHSKVTRTHSGLTRKHSGLQHSNSNLSSQKENNTNNTRSSTFRHLLKSRSMELESKRPHGDTDSFDIIQRLRRAGSVGEVARSSSSGLIELLFAPGRGVAKLQDAVLVTQRRWMSWIHVAALLEQLLEVFSAREKTKQPLLQRAHTGPVGSDASNAIRTSADDTGNVQGDRPGTRMARLQICETIALLFSAWGSSTWFEEMPKPVASSLLGSACQLLRAALPQELPHNVAAFGQLPLVTAAAVLGMPTPSPRALLSLACGDGEGDNLESKLLPLLREAAWAAYLAKALLGPRADAVAQVQAAVRPLCDVVSGSGTSLSNSLPSLATGERPNSPEKALAELLVLLRRLLDVAPAGSPPVLLDLPDLLLQRPALRALTLTVLASAIRGGATPPSHVDVALVPLSSTSPWEQLAAQQLVRIWQELLVRASSTDERECEEHFHPWRGSAAALVARLEWRRPELALAALAVLGCRCEATSLREVSKAGASHLQKGWQPPPALEWVEPLDDEPPETVRHLVPDERAALFRACLQLLRDIGEAVRPINDAGMPTKPFMQGVRCVGLRCGRVLCKYANPCSACVAASQMAGIETNSVAEAAKGAPLNCTFDPDSQGWNTDGALANMNMRGPSQLVSRESAASGVLQWTIRLDPEDLPVELGVVPDDSKNSADFMWTHTGSGVRSISAERNRNKRAEDLRGLLVQVRCDLDRKTISWRKGASPESLVEFLNSACPAEFHDKKLRLCITCMPSQQVEFPCVHLVSSPGYGIPDVCCKRGHPLNPVGTTLDNGWRCDAAQESRGCLRGVSGFGQTNGVPRFRCAQCDYDLCNLCYDAAVQEITQKQPSQPVSATATFQNASSSGEEPLTSTKLQLSEELWNHAAGVATWLLRDLPPTAETAPVVERLCSEILGDWLSLSSNAALGEANDSAGHGMSDARFVSAAALPALDLHAMCGFVLEPPSNSTWASWRSALTDAVGSGVPISNSKKVTSVDVPRKPQSFLQSVNCAICKKICACTGPGEVNLCCYSCGRPGATYKCSESSCVGWSVCKDCANWPSSFGALSHAHSSQPCDTATDMGELGLIARVPPQLLTEVCIWSPAELSSALVAGTAWPLLRHAIKHRSAAGGDDESIWSSTVAAAVSGAALEAECLSDLLGVVLAVQRGVDWPKGSGWGPDLRSGLWLFQAILQKSSQLLPSGRLWLAVIRTLQCVPNTIFETMFGGLATRIGLCQALARAPLGALSTAEIDLIVEEALRLVEMLADESTPGSAACLTNIVAALISLITRVGRISALARPRAMALVTALAFCQAKKSLLSAETTDFERVAAPVDTSPSDQPLLPLPLLRRFLQLPCQEETLVLQLCADEPLLLQVPTAAEYEVFARIDTDATVQDARLAVVATASQERGNAVLGEVALSSELQSLGRYEGRDIILGVELPPVGSKTDAKLETQPQVADANQMLPLGGVSDPDVPRDAFGRPLAGQTGVPSPTFSFAAQAARPPLDKIDGLRFESITDRSFEESRWSHYKQFQPKEDDALPSEDVPVLRWAPISEEVPDGWRIATRSDVGRLPAVAATAAAAAGAELPCRLESPWVLDLAGLPAVPTWRRAEDNGDEWDLLEGHLLAKLDGLKCSQLHHKSTFTVGPESADATSSADSPAYVRLNAEECRMFVDVSVRSGLSVVMGSNEQPLPEDVPAVAVGAMTQAPKGACGRPQTAEESHYMKEAQAVKAAEDKKSLESRALWAARKQLGNAKSRQDKKKLHDLAIKLQGKMEQTSGEAEKTVTKQQTKTIGGLTALRGGLWFTGADKTFSSKGSALAGLSECHLSSGCWFYEVEMLDGGLDANIGWMAVASQASLKDGPEVLGFDRSSWAITTANFRQQKGTNVIFKEIGPAPTRVGAAVDLNTKQMWFAINGNWSLAADFQNFSLSAGTESAKWEVQTDAGWRPFSPPALANRSGDQISYSIGDNHYQATFTSDTHGTQRNTRTGTVRQLRNASVPLFTEKSADTSAYIIPAVSGKARCVLHTSRSSIKFPPVHGSKFKPLDELGEPDVGKACGLCYYNESPALPFRFEVEVTELSGEGGQAAVGVAWGTWNTAKEAGTSASAAPDAGTNASGALLFGAASSSGSSGGLFSFGPAAPASSSSMFAPAASTGSIFGGPEPAPSLFGSGAGGSLFGGGLFGAGSGTMAASSGASIFGSDPGTRGSGLGLFGSSPTAVLTSGGLFGSPTMGAAPAPANVGSLFGTSGASAAASSSSSNLFATSASIFATSSSSIFGHTVPAGPAAGGLFGSAATGAAVQTSGGIAAGGLFGVAATGAPVQSSDPVAAGGLFGSAATGAAVQTSGGIAAGGLFGAAATGAPAQSSDSVAAGGLFGSAATVGSEQSSGAASSSSSSAPVPTNGSLFGGALSAPESPECPGAANNVTTDSDGNATRADSRWWKPGSISWLWHSDGRLECAGAPWSAAMGVCFSDTGQTYTTGDMVTVEFMPSVPALLFSKNGLPAFALHMVDGYSNEPASDELELLRAASADVLLPVPGLFAGAQPAVRLTGGGVLSLGHFSIDGQDVSGASWSREHKDPLKRTVRLPAFATETELEGTLSSQASSNSLPPSCIQSCGYGVKVQPMVQNTWIGATHRLELVVRSTPRDPLFLDKVLAKWTEVQHDTGSGTAAVQMPEGEAGAVIVEDSTHRFYSKLCMVCKECNLCTGYGVACVRNTVSEGRTRGGVCGCGGADATHNSGCEVCGRCQSCAAKTPCNTRKRAVNPISQAADPILQAVEILQNNMKASAEVAISVLAPLYAEPVLSDSTAEERAQWQCLATMLPQARRRERWIQALARQSVAETSGEIVNARLKRRAAAAQADATAADKASVVPVWEQLATQVAGFSNRSLQNSANPFNVTFIGEEDVLDRSIRRCPRCGRLLQKSDGCDSMACCMYGSDNCRGAHCDHGGGCGHRFDWNQTLVLGPFQEALEAFSADFMASDLLTDCPNRRSRDGPNQDTRLPHPHPARRLSNPEDYRKLFQGLGRMMGVAIRVQLPLRLALNPLVWSWLHNGGHEGLDLRQLTESAQQTSQMVRYLRGITSPQDLAALGVDVEFAAENSAGELVHLGTPGRTVLNVEDAHELSDCLERLHLVEGLEPLAPVAEGLSSVLPLGMMRLLLDPPTLEEAVCGATDVNLAELREHTELVAPEENSSTSAEVVIPLSSDQPKANSTAPADTSVADGSKSSSTESVLDWLFQALEGFTPSERRGFVRLISGNRRLPEHGEWRMRVRLDAPEEQGGSALPTARECAMLLTVPRCSGVADLAQRLRVTIASSDAQMMS